MSEEKSSSRRLLLLVAPLILLAGVIVLFLVTSGAGLNVKPVVPVESVQMDRPVLKQGEIQIGIRNTGQQELQIAAINVNDAIWPFEASQNPIPRLGKSTITLIYPWVEGVPYTITMFSSNSIPLETVIDVATVTKTTSSATLGKLTLVGVYVGIIPVVLGMLWLPLLGNMSRKWLKFLMAATVGLLIFLGIDATVEAIEQAGELAGPYQGIGLIGVGTILTFALLQAIGARQAGLENGQSRNVTFATMVAIGIGLHNLGEGLAIGASFAIGAATLGTFLVIGFIIQNVTEGLGVVVPLAKEKPTLLRLATLGAVAGAPAILGTWIGGYWSSTALSVLFLSIGAGAVFQVAWAIGRELVWKPGEKADRSLPLTAFSGLATGMLALFVMGIFIK